MMDQRSEAGSIGFMGMVKLQRLCRVIRLPNIEPKKGLQYICIVAFLESLSVSLEEKCIALSIFSSCAEN